MGTSWNTSSKTCEGVISQDATLHTSQTWGKAAPSAVGDRSKLTTDLPPHDALEGVISQGADGRRRITRKVRDMTSTVQSVVQDVRRYWVASVASSWATATDGPAMHVRCVLLSNTWQRGGARAQIRAWTRRVSLPSPGRAFESARMCDARAAASLQPPWLAPHGRRVVLVGRPPARPQGAPI